MLTLTIGDEYPDITQSLVDNQGGALDLTDATVTYRARELASSSLAVDQEAVVVDAPTGAVKYSPAGEDFATAGVYITEWYVEWTGTDITVAGDGILVVSSISAVPSLSSADLARLRSRVGASTPPTDVDLATLVRALGSVDAAARAVLEGRYAEIISGPSKYRLDGDMEVDFSGSLPRLEAAMASLADPATVMATGRLYRDDVQR